MGEVYSHLSEEERQVIQIEVGNGASIRGSGTTLEACLLEHMQCTASELDSDYIKLIHARLSKPIQNELF